MSDVPSRPRAGATDERAAPETGAAAAGGGSAEELAPGVRELDHTADVGISVSAADPSQLFRRAARGMARLMRGVGPPAEEPIAAEGPIAAEERRLELSADSLDLLLVRWLAELLYLDEVEGFVFEDATFENGSFEDASPDHEGETRLRGIVRGRLEPGVAERQLKGVTYHGLRLDSVADGWRAEVIFDI